MWASGSGEDPNTHGLDQTRILGWMDECHPLRSLHLYESDWWPLLRRSSVLTQAGEDCLPVCQPAYRALHAFSQAWNRWRTGGALNESTEIQINSYFFSEISASMLMYRIFIAQVLELCLTFTQSLFEGHKIKSHFYHPQKVCDRSHIHTHWWSLLKISEEKSWLYMPQNLRKWKSLFILISIWLNIQ